MKKSSLVTLLFVCFCCSVVSAQDKKFEVRAGGGLAPTLGSEDFKELYALAIHAGADVAYLVKPKITFGGSLNYGRFGLDKDAALSGQSGSVEGGTFSGLEVIGMLRYYFKTAEEAGSARFYLLGGLGMAFYKQADVTIRTSNSTTTFSSERQSDLMLSLGAGSKFGGRFFVEATLSIVFADPDNATYLPLRAGIVF